MVRKIVAVTVIMGCTWAAWLFLSSVMERRSREAGRSMSDAVGGLWGEQHAQGAPSVEMDWVSSRREEMSDEDRLKYKEEKQSQENLKAEVEGRDRRRVVVSIDEIKRIVRDMTEDERSEFLRARQMEEDDQSWLEGRPPRLVVYIEDDLNRAIKSRRTYGNRRLTRAEDFVVLAQQSSYNAVASAPREYLLLPPEEFIRVVKEEHRETPDLSASDIKVNLDLDYRQKGLLWFSTYNVIFDADYAVENPAEEPVRVTMVFPFPSDRAIYDNLKVEAPGIADFRYETQTETEASSDDPIIATFTLGALARQTVKFSYKSRGLDQWSYRFGDSSRMVRNFSLVMTTNFKDIDFPRDSISPDDKTPGPDGWSLAWKKDSLVSSFQIGMVMPRKINPGPLASAMSGHAPVSLLFYFFVLFLLQELRNLKIHPMNYFFIAASFFAFNLLFSYLVDHLDLVPSFLIASLVSIFLVASYLRLVVGGRFALVEAGLSQLIYQVMFAFAHFYEGYTGLAITIGAVLTLAVVMRLTAKIDWQKKFEDKDWGSLPGRKGGQMVFTPPPLNPEVPRG